MMAAFSCHAVFPSDDRNIFVIAALSVCGRYWMC